MFPSYLRGEWRNEGWWYYYLYVLAVKTPLGAIGLFAVAAFLSIWLPKAPLRDEVLLLAPAAAILILVSSQTGFSVHGRYVWPAIPYLYVFAGQAGRLVSRATPKSAALVIALAVASAGSMLWHCPHSVAYFNEAAGGPKNGAFHLHDSNVSWGQDLLHLKRWLDANPDARPFYLLAGNGIEPELAGIDYELPPFARPEPADGLPKRGVADEDNAAKEGDGEWSQLPAGWYAIDVVQLHHPGRAPYYGHGVHPKFDERCKAALQELAAREPDAMAGYSIWIYHVPKENSNR